MIQDRLNDAAIALFRCFSHDDVAFGIFGGYAIGTMGGTRATKDIDCLVSLDKAQVVQLLDNKDGFEVISQNRQDYVMFFWSDRADRSNAVMVEVFCEKFPGAQYTMSKLTVQEIDLKGSSMQGKSNFLTPFYLFKGKLHAAATRGKYHDSADLRMLVTKYKNEIEPYVGELSMEYVGLAIKRYEILQRLFEQIGVDTQKASECVEHLELDRLPAPAPGDVQKGLLA